MANDTSVLLVGGSDAGKSNFLFRVWLAIDSKTGVLQGDGIPRDLAYLKSGVEQLLSGDFAAKTSTEVNDRSPIPVKYNQGGETARGVLLMPDCPGEQWMAIYHKREWSEEWERLILEGCGCLIFVRATSEQNIVHLDWISYYKQFGTTIGPSNDVEASKIDANAKSNTGNVPIGETRTPTQVVLVDWLQCIKRAFSSKVGSGFRPRVGIVVTAWDALPEDQQSKSPFTWIQENFPMFGHYLESNHDQFCLEVFGVSVVGGDLSRGKSGKHNNPDFYKQYRSVDPTTAGYVMVGTCRGDAIKCLDLTIPIAWAMGMGLDFLQKTEQRRS